MHGLAVYVKEGLPFARDLSLENYVDSFLRFPSVLLYSVSYFFFLYQSPSSSLCMVSDAISSNIDEVLSINPSANVFVFVDFNVHHTEWLTYSGGTDRPGESQMTLPRWLNFLLRSLTLTLTVLLFWIYLFLLTLVFVVQRLSLQWGILIMLSQ